MLSYEELLEIAIEIDNMDRKREDDLLKEINEIYDDLYDEIIDIILSLYGEYGEDVTWNELHKNVKPNKIIQTSKRMERLKKLKDSTDIKEVKARLNDEIKLLRGRGIITGDKFFSDKINERMLKATTKVSIKMNKFLEETFIREYLRATGKAPTQKTIDIFLTTPHFGTNWYNRLFDNKNKVLNSIKAEVLKGIMRGTHYRETIKKVQKIGNMSRRQAETLVRTENAMARAEGLMEGYLADDMVTHVIFIAVGDNKTCPGCNERDGMVVRKEDVKMDGIILHANCRCTIAPYSK